MQIQKRDLTFMYAVIHSYIAVITLTHCQEKKELSYFHLNYAIHRN